MKGIPVGVVYMAQVCSHALGSWEDLPRVTFLGVAPVSDSGGGYKPTGWTNQAKGEGAYLHTGWTNQARRKGRGYITASGYGGPAGEE
eukprot:3424274-Pyramimonas_sp.AAC.2